MSSDATTTVMGAIDWKHGAVFRETVESLRPWIERVLTDQEREAADPDLVIHLGEMLSFVAFACKMGEAWAGKVVVYAGDNMVVKNWIQGRHSRVRGGRLLIRVLNMVELKWGCVILAGWWRTYHNVDADFITRCTEGEFEAYKAERAWREIDVKEAIKQALQDTERYGPCFIYGADEEDRKVQIQLKERRVQRQVQKEIKIPWATIRVVEWAAHGRTIKDFEDAAGNLGARLEGREGEEPVILCATLGVDSQGRHLTKVLAAAKTVGAWVCLIEGPRAVAWDVGEMKCQKEAWGYGMLEFITTELGEASARRRKCLVVRPGGELPLMWEESLVRVGAPVPVRTILKPEPWESLVWVKPYKLEIDTGIPRDRMLPHPVGHFQWSEEDDRRTCHSVDGPCLWAKLGETPHKVESQFVYDRRGPPACLRRLRPEEVWVLQGRGRGDLGKEEIEEKVTQGCRATGVHTAESLLLLGGHLIEKIALESSTKAGMCQEVEGPEALAQILVWLRKWRKGDFGRYAGTADYQETKTVIRWVESWWMSMLDEESDSDEDQPRKAGGKRSKMTPSELAEKVSKTMVSNVGAPIRPFCGEVKERVEEWLEDNMTGDKSPATERAYAGGWEKWKAWARRQQWLSEYLSPKEDPIERENKLLAFIGYLGWLGASVNTIRLNIFAIKTAHKRAGAGDITEGMHRVWILLAGLDRRTTRKPKRLGVTPEMLQWLGEELIGKIENRRQAAAYADAVMVIAAMATAWFYMLRAKEFADSNGIDQDMIIRGCDLRFASDGRSATNEVQEVTLRFRKTKTDQLSFGDAKTLQSTGKRFLCPVEALVRMRKVWPLRFLAGHQESQRPLFRWSAGSVIKRLEIQHLLQKAAEGVGLPPDRFLSHSLRIGGATALYQATGDIELVKRLGRWTSSAVHRYLEDGGTISKSSVRMADVKVKAL